MRNALSRQPWTAPSNGPRCSDPTVTVCSGIPPKKGDDPDPGWGLDELGNWEIGKRSRTVLWYIMVF